METGCKQTQSIQRKVIEELERAPDTTQRIWEPWQDDILRKYYRLKGAIAVGKALGKTKDQVYNRAARLGIKRQ